MLHTVRDIRRNLRIARRQVLFGAISSASIESRQEAIGRAMLNFYMAVSRAGLDILPESEDGPHAPRAEHAIPLLRLAENQLRRVIERPIPQAKKGEYVFAATYNLFGALTAALSAPASSR